MEMVVNNEASMNLPIKQMILKRVIGLKKSPFLRPHLPDLIIASTVEFTEMTIDRSRMDSFVAPQHCWRYFQIATRTGDVSTSEFLTLTGKMVDTHFQCIFDTGANKDLDDGILSVFAVNYSGKCYIRRPKKLPEDASDLARLLFTGRQNFCGYRDDNGEFVIDIKKGCKAFREAAKMGSAEAQYALGIIYHNGIDCVKNSRKAKTYFQLAANSNEPKSSCAAMNFALEEGIQLEVE